MFGLGAGGRGGCGDARGGRLRAALAALLLLAPPIAAPIAPATAQDAATPATAGASAEQDARRARLDEIEAFIEDPESPIGEIEALGNELRTLRADSFALVNRLAGPRADARRALDALGPAPGADEPPEPDAVAVRRAELASSAAALDAVARLSEVNIAAANRLIERIGALRRERFFERLQEPRASVAAPGTWADAAQGAGAAAGAVRAAVAAWADERRAAGGFAVALAALAAAVAAALVLSFPVRILARGGIGRLSAASRLGGQSKGVAAGLRAATHGAAAAASLFVLFAAARAVGLGVEPLGTIAGPAFAAAFFVAVAHALARAWYAPADAAVRLSGADDARARRIWLRLVLVAAVAGIGWAVATAGGALEADGASLDAAAAIEGLLGAVALLAFAAGLRDRKQTVEGEAAPASQPSRGRAWLRALVTVAAAAAVAAAVGGYSELSRFFVERTALALVAGFLFAVVRAFVQAIALGVLAPRVRHGRPEGGDEALSFWIRLLIDATLGLIALPFAAMIAGASRGDIADLLARATLGFRIGSIQFSLANIAIGAAVFAGSLIATRVAQRGLRESVLPRTRTDSGVRNSVVALVGYAGLILAFLLAVAAAGVDLTSFAIIAGALSVGVGFGLQGFVNNFVSGLTLLFERPFKIGDWIVLQSGQGYVRKIGMRATEIETFDRATIIVPNAELIGTAFTNWTLRDRIGRIIVPVGVSYDSDPALVQKLLLEAAEAHQDVLAEPAPFALWKDFGASSLDFELRVYIRDIASTFRVQNDLRHAIWGAFKANGIEIPFPQHVVHMAAARDEGEAE